MTNRKPFLKDRFMAGFKHAVDGTARSHIDSLMKFTDVLQDHREAYIGGYEYGLKVMEELRNHLKKIFP